MRSKAPSRTRFYKDKRGGKFMGVCAGIADYTGFDVTLVRIVFVLAVLMGSGVPLLLYLIAGMIAEDKPSALRGGDPDQEHFWQGVRQSPARTARDIRSRLRDIDRRLADVEQYVLTENRSLAREIEQLR